MNLSRTFSMVLVTLVFAASSIATAQMQAKIVAADQVQFAPAPGAKGVQTATLAGTPNGNGWFTERVKMVAGASNPPHTHKHAQLVTVISGVMQVGFGTTMNKNNMRTVTAGGIVTIPAGAPHYSTAKTNLVYDVSGMGPSTNIPIKKTAKM
jgi:quercetin dioxygenase-like cupin family protein